MASIFTLDLKGAFLALVLGILIFLLGRNYGGIFITAILIFLLLSAVVTELGRLKKQGIGAYEKTRGWKNVLSNGSVPFLVALLYYLGYVGGAGGSTLTAIALMYIASVAAVTADKFSSEIGILDGEPIMLATLKHVKKGTSGGITWLGLVSSAIGALIISMSALLISPSLWFVAITFVSGVAGGIVDSLFGYWEEKGIGNKYTSNFLCSLAGAVICMLLVIY